MNIESTRKHLRGERSMTKFDQLMNRGGIHFWLFTMVAFKVFMLFLVLVMGF